MSSKPQITYPAIVVPRWRKDLLSRPRLLEQFYNLLERKLILVVAPAGYGKTSMMIDLAHQENISVCWHTIDMYEQDVRRFLMHFVKAIAQRYPEVGQEAATMFASDNLPDLNILAILLSNEIYQYVDGHFLIVLDDFHEVGENPEIVKFIQLFIQNAPENCCLALLSRRRPRLPGLATLLARGQVGSIGPEGLAFTTKEIQELVQQNHKVTLSTEQASHLAQVTAGWVAGLLLGGPTWWQELAGIQHGKFVTGVNLDHFWADHLAGLPAELQDFILRSSLLETFNCARCEQVLYPIIYPAQTDWHALIEEVLQRNLFVLLWGKEDTWLRYHPLFQTYLQKRMAQERPGEAKTIWRRLVEIYSAEQEWEKAHDTCHNLGDWQAMADLLETSGRPLVRSGQHLLLGKWLDELPPELLASRPYLLSHKGITLIFGRNPLQAIELFNQAIDRLQDQGNPFHLAQTLARRANAHHQQGNYTLSMQDAQTLLTLTQDDPALRVHYAEGLSLVGLNQRQMGQTESAIHCLEQALALYQELGDEYSAANTLLTLGLSHRFLGDFQAAMDAYNQSLAYWRKTGILQTGADLLNNMAVLYNLLGEYEQSASLLQEGLQMARQNGYIRAEAFLLSTQGALYSALQDFNVAQTIYHQARRIARKAANRQILDHLDRAEAEIAWQTGDFAHARRLLQSADALARQSGSIREQTLCRRAWGLLALAEGDLALARSELQKALDALVEGNWDVEAAQTAIHLATACQQMQDWPATIRVLKSAFERIRPEYWQILVLPGMDARSLLEQARNEPALRRQANRLLEQIARFEQRLPGLRRKLCQEVRNTPAELTVRTLGEMEIYREDHLISWTEWQSQIQREVFLFILNHPQGVTRTRLLATFWPDDQHADVSCDRALMGIRRNISKRLLLYENGHYSFNRSVDYEYDAEQFDQLLQRARSASNPDEKAELCGQAMALYRGLYFPEATGVWVIEERQRLHQRYAEAATSVIRRHMERREYPISLDYAWRALHIDPCLENIHRLCMQIYAASGDRPAIEHQYQWCCQAFQEHLHMRPSNRTEMLYQRLMR